MNSDCLIGYTSPLRLKADERSVADANSGRISTWRDGRVVDGGNLEYLIARSSELVIFPHSARDVKYASMIGSRPACPDLSTSSAKSASAWCPR